jgi:hypothetical protein
MLYYLSAQTRKRQAAIASKTWFEAKVNRFFSEARFAGLNPWFAPVRGGVGGLQFGPVRRAICIFAPRSTPNELGLIAFTLFSEGRVAVAAEERQHAIHHCLLGLCRRRSWGKIIRSELYMLRSFKNISVV